MGVSNKDCLHGRDSRCHQCSMTSGRKTLGDPGWLEFCKKRKADVEQPIFGKELKEEIKSCIDDMQKWIPVFKKYGL